MEIAAVLAVGLGGLWFLKSRAEAAERRVRAVAATRGARRSVAGPARGPSVREAETVRRVVLELHEPDGDVVGRLVGGGGRLTGGAATR